MIVNAKGRTYRPTYCDLIKTLITPWTSVEEIKTSTAILHTTQYAFSLVTSHTLFGDFVNI